MPTDASSRRIHELGDWRLDPDEHLLLRQGNPVPLTPKVFQTLGGQRWQITMDCSVSIVTTIFSQVPLPHCPFGLPRLRISDRLLRTWVFRPAITPRTWCRVRQVVRKSL
jgi:hypothetical protein